MLPLTLGEARLALDLTLEGLRDIEEKAYRG